MEFNKLCPIIPDVYVSQYIEFVAIQKSLFQIQKFSQVDCHIISQAANYCKKQPNLGFLGIALY